AAIRNYEIRQGDVTTAFLGRELQKQDHIYLIPPREMGPMPGKLLKVGKSIYRLRISPLIWNKKLHKALRKLGMQRSLYDTGLYYSEAREAYILVFVDDIVIIAEKEVSDHLEKELIKELNIKEFNNIHQFLGAKIIRDRENKTLFISQESYIDRLLQK